MELVRQMEEYKTQGLDEMDAPIFKVLEEIVNFVEEPCLLLIEPCVAGKHQWQFSIADSRFELPKG